jgi:hypothetical protein
VKRSDLARVAAPVVAPHTQTVLTEQLVSPEL